jgi:HSP20 family protein
VTDHTPDHEVELFKREDAYEVYVRLPGYDSEDIDVRWHESRLHVAAEHHEGGETSVFNRHVSLPRAVAADAIDATFHDGVLEVVLPTTDDDERPGVHVDVSGEP